MLLAVDVGNTLTSFAAFDGEEILCRFELPTQRGATGDSLAGSLLPLLKLHGVEPRHIGGLAVCSVVPPLNRALLDFGRKWLRREPVFVGPGSLPEGMLLVDNPRQVGADRVANSVAAFERYRGACIVVDFGTATTIDVVDHEGRYLGGAIAPGPETAARALSLAAAQLPPIPLALPGRALGKNTVEAMQAGVVLGLCKLVDGLVAEYEGELGEVKGVVATGGLAPLLGPACQKVREVDLDLTLKGIRILFERSAGR